MKNDLPTYSLDAINGCSAGSNSIYADRADEVKQGRALVLVRGRTFKVKKGVASNRLKAGMLLLACYNQYNQGADIIEFKGFTGHENQYATPLEWKFKDAKSLYKAYGVKNLRQLEAYQDAHYEYGHSTHMGGVYLDTDYEDACYYAYKGRWVRGSGAETVSFYLLEEVK